MRIKEQLFVEYYLGEAKCNGTRAATLAGYKHPRQIATRLLSKIHIKEAVKAKVTRVVMRQEEVLARLSARAASSVEDFVTFDNPADPNALPSLDLTRAKRRGAMGSVKKVKTTRTPGNNPMEIVEVEVHDALPALALLAKYHGLLDAKPPDKDADFGDAKATLARKLARLEGAEGGGGVRGFADGA